MNLRGEPNSFTFRFVSGTGGAQYATNFFVVQGRATDFADL